MNIIELAKEAGLVFGLQMYVDHYQLERFAALVRAKALEEAAKVCAMMEWQGRSEEAIWKGDAADECAAAIRGLK